MLYSLSKLVYCFYVSSSANIATYCSNYHRARSPAVGMLIDLIVGRLSNG